MGAAMPMVTARVDQQTKDAVDAIFSRIGLNTSTAIRMFLKASIKANGLPIETREYLITPELAEALEDSLLLRNLHGPFKSGREAVESALQD
jgi:DNA-damage-inducible protein J